MYRQSWAVVWQRCAHLPGACLGLLLASQWRLGARALSLDLWLYGACFALLAGLGLALLWLLFAWLEQRSPQRAGLLVPVVCFPFVHAVGVHLSGSDGLRARGFSAGLLELGFTTALLGLPLLTWLLQRFIRPRSLHLALGAGLLLALVWLDSRVARYQGELAALVEACAVLVFATLVTSALALVPGVATCAALASLGLVLCLALLAAALPERVASGRRQARVLESSLDYLDGRLVRRLRLAREPAATPLPTARCADLLRSERFAPLPLARERRRNVILISIDSVRADHVRRELAGRPVMPALRSFLAEQSGPGSAFTAYPATALAMSAAFSGLMPSELLLSTAPADNLFMRSRGLVDRTEAVLPTGNYFQRPDVVHYLLRGARVSTAPAGKQTELAIQRLREARAAGETQLLWLHYFEPHEPYLRRRGFGFGDSDRQRYASELAYADNELSKLLAVLREEGWYEDSLIVVFADHGEAFGEHRHFYHHYLLYPWLIEVPFGLRAPGKLAMRGGTIQLTDLAPTVLHFLGAEHAGRALTGRSLFGAEDVTRRVVIGEAFPVSGSTLLAYARDPIGSEPELLERLAQIERGPGYPSKLALAAQGHRLILHRGSGASELYAESDRRAEHDLADTASGLRDRLVQLAEQWRERLVTGARCALREQQLSAGQAEKARQ